MVPDKAETIDALLARYVAGMLPEPARVLVESHLAIKADNRRMTAALESLAGRALDAEQPIALSDPDRRLAGIIASQAPAAAERTPHGDAHGLFPWPLRDFVGFDVGDVPWRTKLPGFREHVVGEVDGCHVTLFAIRPGRKIPAHTHEGTELSLVLDGDFKDGIGHYGRGDISIADDTIDHRPIAGRDRPCIGFAVTDGPLRLTGRLHQRLGDILGL